MTRQQNITKFPTFKTGKRNLTKLQRNDNRQAKLISSTGGEESSINIYIAKQYRLTLFNSSAEAGYSVPDVFSQTKRGYLTKIWPRQINEHNL